MLPRTCSGELYNILQLSRDCTTDDIRRQYRRLAIQYHPDKTHGQTTEQFKAIEEAHRILSDPETRKLYNLFGRTGLTYLGDSGLPRVVQSIAVIKGVVLCIGLELGAWLASILLFCYKVDHPEFALSYGWIFAPLWINTPLFVLAAVLSLLVASRECQLDQFFTSLQLILIACTLTAFALALFQFKSSDSHDSNVHSLSSFTTFFALWMATYVVFMLKGMKQLTPSAFAASHPTETNGSTLREDGYIRVSSHANLHNNDDNNNNNNDNADDGHQLHGERGDAFVLSPRARAWIAYCVYVLFFVLDKACVIAFFTLIIIRTTQHPHDNTVSNVIDNDKLQKEIHSNFFDITTINVTNNNNYNYTAIHRHSNVQSGNVNTNKRLQKSQVMMFELHLSFHLLSFWVIFGPLILQQIIHMTADVLIACYSAESPYKTRFVNLEDARNNNNNSNTASNNLGVNDINVEIEADNDVGPFDVPTHSATSTPAAAAAAAALAATHMDQLNTAPIMQEEELQQQEQQEERQQQVFTNYVISEVCHSVCDRVSAALFSCVGYIFPLYMLLMWASKSNYLLNGKTNSYNPSALVATLPLVLLLGILTLIPCCVICIMAQLSADDVVESYMSSQSPDMTQVHTHEQTNIANTTPHRSDNVNQDQKRTIINTDDNRRTPQTSKVNRQNIHDANKEHKLKGEEQNKTTIAPHENNDDKVSQKNNSALSKKNDNNLKIKGTNANLS